MRTRPLVLAAFAALALLFAGMGIATAARVRHAQLLTRTLVGNMFQSIQLVSAMGRDADRERLLLDEHIFEKSRDRMRELEAEMDAVQVDFDEKAEAYEPIVTLPGERAAWDKLQRDVAAVREPVLHVVALSNDQQDVEAYRAREQLNPLFSAIGDGVEVLVRINREGADRAVAEMASLQRTSAMFVMIMGAVGIALTLLIGTGVMRMVLWSESLLRGQNAALEARNRDLDAFAGRVAHDLRGPLNTVGVAAARLEQRTAGEAGSTAILRRAVGRMERLIADLLALSRLGFPQADSPCDPVAAAAEVEEDLAPQIAGAQAHLSVHVDSAPVRCTSALLRQLIFNLAENAIKYRRSDVPLHLDIDGHRVDGEYELSVCDNGRGMSPEQAHLAFAPFYRGASDTPGTGLGLSIVKRIAEAAGGTVRVDSRLGQGSAFVVTLPLAGSANCS